MQRYSEMYIPKIDRLLKEFLSYVQQGPCSGYTLCFCTELIYLKVIYSLKSCLISASPSQEHCIRIATDQ